MSAEKPTKTTSTIPTFNLIAMKDVKDKTTRKGSLRPLFDCIDSFASAVDALHEFLSSNPEDEDKKLISSFVDGLTNMQVKLLELCQDKIRTQNIYVPENESQLPEEGANVEIPKGNSPTQPPQQAAVLKQIVKQR